ncbi:MAG: hypothetical protein ACI3V3_09310 [Faecousia sp.]
MTDEKMISGYCRTQDQSRMVLVEYEAGTLVDVDCCYGDCPFQGSCEIAKAIDALLRR